MYSNFKTVKNDKTLVSFLSDYLYKNTDILYDDPTTLGFNLVFEFNFNSPLLNTSDYGDSAIKFLKLNGELGRAGLLNRFIERLRQITNDYPYYLQKINGLDKIYDINPNDSNLKLELEIETLESLDLRISGLVDDYVQATYDMANRRSILPDNLTWFTMKVVVSEIRNYKTFVHKLDSLNNTVKSFAPTIDSELTIDFDYSKRWIDLNNSLKSFVVTFDMCQFNFKTSNNFLASINNARPEVASNKFKVNCGVLSSVTDLYDKKIITNMLHDIEISNIDTRSMTQRYKDSIKAIMSGDKKQITQEAKLAINKIKNDTINGTSSTIRNQLFGAANAQIGKFTMGNVLFRNERIDVEGLITGDQKLSDLNPLAGRIGDYEKLIVDIILGLNKSATSAVAPLTAKNLIPKAFRK